MIFMQCKCNHHVGGDLKFGDLEHDLPGDLTCDDEYMHNERNPDFQSA